MKIEMGATVWERFPQLKTLPEEALGCFVAAQTLPEGASQADLAASMKLFHNLLLVYRQCRHAFHTLAVSIEDTPPRSDGTPAVLLPLSSERWPTFREMFPGIKEDDTHRYGPAVRLPLPGKHIEMVDRCLGNRDVAFCGAVERFLSGSFDDSCGLIGVRTHAAWVTNSYLLHTTYHSLLTTYYLLPKGSATNSYLLHTTYHSLLTTYYLLPKGSATNFCSTTCYLLLTTYYLLLTT